MDHKMVKKMKKRKDLDRLIGNGRKHIRKKSGHVLLRQDSQSSLSSDDIEQLNQVSVVDYKKSRCSSFLLYASICLSICTLIFCCVVFGLIFALRTHIYQLDSTIQKASVDVKERRHEIQDIYSRLQTLQVHVHRLHVNMSQQFDNFKKASMHFNGLAKQFQDFKHHERLLGSLSNVPADIKKLKEKTGTLNKSLNTIQLRLRGASQKITKLMSGFDEIKTKLPILHTNHSAKTSPGVDSRLDEFEKHLSALESNITDLKRIKMNENHRGRKSDAETKNGSSLSDDSEKEIENMKKRLRVTEKQVAVLKARVDRYSNASDRSQNTAAPENWSSNLKKIEVEIKSNKHRIDRLLSKITNSKNSQSGVIHSSTERESQATAADIQYLNSTLTNLLKRLPEDKITLGFGVSSNKTSSNEPLGHGVILTRREYYKLRQFWARASDSYILSVQSKQRIDKLENKFEKLKKQVVNALKNIKVAAEAAKKKNRPEMEINVPIPVYSTPRNPSAPTPDPHLKLPWVKTLRDAEINFARWNRNGDDVISGEELNPAALRGFMGPYTPTREQLMHFDVNKDNRLSKKEVLCLFGYIPWPCTGKPTSTLKPEASPEAFTTPMSPVDTTTASMQRTKVTSIKGSQMGSPTSVREKEKPSRTTSPSRKLTTTISPKKSSTTISIKRKEI